MRRKLGLLAKSESDDPQLVSDLLSLMADTGADFTNIFRGLARVPMPAPGGRWAGRGVLSRWLGERECLGEGRCLRCLVAVA